MALVLRLIENGPMAPILIIYILRKLFFQQEALKQMILQLHVNGVRVMASACLGYSLIFNVFDPVTFKPWKNVDALGNNLYLSGSASANCDATPK